MKSATPRYVFLVVLLATTVAMWPRPGAAEGLHADQEKAIDRYLGELIEGVEPGVAVGVVRGGEVVLERYEGYANLEHEVPLDARSRFNIASNAKQYTALMVLDLARSGVIDPAEDFRRYLPGSLPDVAAKITVRDLVTHSSGIRDVYDLWGLTGVTWYERPFRNRDALALLDRQQDLNFEPGSAYLYSNSNYILLAALVAAVTEQPFHGYAKSFFERLGMNDTGFRRRYGVIVPHLARPYGQWNGWLEGASIANLHGDGFLYTTLRDQLAWERQVQGGETSLDRATVAASQRPLTGSSIANYGYGLELGTYKGVPLRSHIGSTGGANAYVMRFPDQQVSIVVIANTTEIGVVGVGRTLADLLLGDAFSAEPDFPAGPDAIGPEPEIADIVGRYELDSSTLVEIVEREGVLYREIEGRDPVRLVHDTGNVYAYETLPDLKIVFTRTPEGVHGFALYLATQAPQVAIRLDAPPTTAAALEALNGAYLNEETGTVIEIAYQQGTAFDVIKNGRRRDGVLVGRDYLRMGSYRIRVTRDAEGAAKGLLVDNNRIRNVRFEREGTR